MIPCTHRGDRCLRRLSCPLCSPAGATGGGTGGDPVAGGGGCGGRSCCWGGSPSSPPWAGSWSAALGRGSALAWTGPGMCWPSGTPAASCRLRSTGSVWSSFVEQAGGVLPPGRPRHRAWRHAMQSATAAVLAGADVAARAVDVWKVYGSSDATRVDALAGVTVDFRRRGFTAIMGPSGSGKSTLLHCLAGLDLVSSGQVWLGDTQVDTLGDRGLTRLPTLTAEENITLPLAIGGRKPDRAWLELVITTVGLGDRLEHRPAQLSGGEQQRVACARALVTRPEVIFADEPTGNLDSRSGAEVLGFLQRSVRELGQTVVMVTHDPTAAAYADRVVFLVDGRIVGELADPTAERVLERMKHLDTSQRSA